MKLFANFFLENPGVNNNVVRPILNMQVFRKFFAHLPSTIQEKKGYALASSTKFLNMLASHVLLATSS